jgi:hypothetical protein
MVSWVRLEGWAGRQAARSACPLSPPEWVMTVDVRRPFLGYRVLDFVWMLKNSSEVSSVRGCGCSIALALQVGKRVPGQDP